MRLSVNYLRFILENRRFLAFGALLSFSSNFGQTYFIALFASHIRGEFALSHGDFGSLYSTATLISALALVWIGRKIDDVDLRLFSALVTAGLAAACFLMASATSVALLFLALLALRLTGQGLMGHTSATSMARYFGNRRGKAISIAFLGYPAGEAVLPLAVVALMVGVGWRQSWVVTGAVLAVMLVPLALWLLKGHGVRHRRYLEDIAAGGTDEADGKGRQWSRREVLGDVRFYLVLPAAMAAPFILTGLFFHQVHLAETKGWSLAWLATCFVGYAVAKLATTLFSGPLIDRLGAVRLLPYFLLPLAAGLLALAAFDHPAAALFYLAMAGVTTGASPVVVGAMWAEVYGVAHLGAIRVLSSALMVFSTALSPAALGWLIDSGVSMQAIVLASVGYIVAASALVSLTIVSRN